MSRITYCLNKLDILHQFFIGIQNFEACFHNTITYCKIPKIAVMMFFEDWNEVWVIFGNFYLTGVTGQQLNSWMHNPSSAAYKLLCGSSYTSDLILFHHMVILLWNQDATCIHFGQIQHAAQILLMLCVSLLIVTCSLMCMLIVSIKLIKSGQMLPFFITQHTKLLLEGQVKQGWMRRTRRKTRMIRRRYFQRLKARIMMTVMLVSDLDIVFGCVIIVLYTHHYSFVKHCLA